MKCPVCFHHCQLSKKGQYGFCKARVFDGEKIVLDNFGYVTSLALDPIEKKPLVQFYPGSYILSVGSYGCNLSCPFCQNYEISQMNLKKTSYYIEPEMLVNKAVELQEEGNIGLAFTYNEPLIGYEYVLACCKLSKEKGLKTVLVTNGCIDISILEKVLPYVDAMNIDLKGFDKTYFDYIGGDLPMTKAFIERAYKVCHIELTTLVVTGKNDDPLLFEKECQWIASLCKDIPLHISRYFPRYKEKAKMTSLDILKEFERIARQYLTSVYLGNC